MKEKECDGRITKQQKKIKEQEEELRHLQQVSVKYISEQFAHLLLCDYAEHSPTFKEKHHSCDGTD